MANDFNNDDLTFKIVAEDDASKVIKKVQKELDKFPNDADKVKYLTSNIAKLTRSMRGLNAEQKKPLKNIRSQLQQLSPNNLKVQPPLKIGTPIETKVLGTTQKKPLEFQGKIVKIKEIGKATTTWTEEIDKNGNKIIRKYKDNIDDAIETVTKFSKKTNKTTNSFKNLKNVAKSASKPFERIGRIFQSIIAFRLASSVITVFINSFKKGFEALKQGNKEFAESLQPFQNSTTAISVSLATTLIPIIQTFAGILQPFANDMINVANAISLANAQAEGQSKYFKLSKDKIDEYAKSLNKTNKQLTQLDKFATLSGQKSYPLGEWVDITPQSISQQNIESGKIGEIAKFIKESIEKVTEFITGLKDLDTQTIKTVGIIGGGLLLLISPFARVIAIASSLFTLFDKDAPLASKAFASAILSATSAIFAFGIAKQFAVSGITGLLSSLAIASAVGLGVGITSFGIGSFTHMQGLNDNTSKSNGIAQNLSNTFAQGFSNFNVQSGDIYLDGKKVGTQLAPTIYSEGKKQQYWK